MKKTLHYRNLNKKKLRKTVKKNNLKGGGLSEDCIQKLQRLLLSIPGESYLSSLNRPIDGKLGEITIKSLQQFLLFHEQQQPENRDNILTPIKQPIDGKLGKKTIKSLQQFLLKQEQLQLEDETNILTKLKKPIDGNLGNKTATVLDNWLNEQLSMLENKTLQEHIDILRDYNRDFHSRSQLVEKRAVLHNMFMEFHYIINNQNIEINTTTVTNVNDINKTYLEKTGIIREHLKKLSSSPYFDELMENYNTTKNSFDKFIRQVLHKYLDRLPAPRK